MFSWIYDLPSWQVTMIFAIGATVFSLSGMLLVRPIFHKLIHGQDKLNEMVSLNIASFSLFFGVMLGLVAVGVYTDYSSTKDMIDREASILAALYSDTNALPEPSRTQLLTDLRNYAKDTIEKDWPIQAKNQVPVAGTDRLNTYQAHLRAVRPATKPEEVAYAEAFGQFQKLVELRSNRLARVTSETPGILWWVIITGAILTIMIVWMLDMQVYVHGILTAVISMFLGIVFFFIADMDQPFRGRELLTPEPYQMAIHDLMRAR